MIEYTKLFILLKELGMKRTDLLDVISPQTLAKLGKNATVQTETIDKVCLRLGAQPSDIMEVFEERLIDGQMVKIKVRDITQTGHDITYGSNTSSDVGITLSDLKKVVDERGFIDVKKLDDLIHKA